MEKYSLEVENWGSYELVKDFTSESNAKGHGQSNFPQNGWRILNRTSGSVVYEYDPLSNMAEEAGQHLQRFSDTETWRRRFSEQAAQRVIARQQRGRMAEIASRQRQSQRNSNQARRTRLDGFVGTPHILDRRIEEWDDDWYDEDDDGRLDLSREKVNWIQEGF
jgi:hypothetical protein